MSLELLPEELLDLVLAFVQLPGGSWLHKFEPEKLPLASLWSLSLSSKHLHRITTPILYRQISIDLIKHRLRARHVVRTLLERPSLALHVKQFCISGSKDRKPFMSDIDANSLPLIETMIAPYEQYEHRPAESSDIFDRVFLALLIVCKNLRVLEFQSEAHYARFAGRIIRAQLEGRIDPATPKLLPAIETIHIRNSDPKSKRDCFPEDLQALRPIPLTFAIPTLKMLTAKGELIDDGEWLDSLGWPRWLRSQGSFNLREIDLDHCTVDYIVFHKFLGRCPRLDTLRMSGVRFSPMDARTRMIGPAFILEGIQSPIRVFCIPYLSKKDWRRGMDKPFWPSLARRTTLDTLGLPFPTLEEYFNNSANVEEGGLLTALLPLRELKDLELYHCPDTASDSILRSLNSLMNDHRFSQLQRIKLFSGRLTFPTDMISPDWKGEALHDLFLLTRTSVKQCEGREADGRYIHTTHSGSSGILRDPQPRPS